MTPTKLKGSKETMDNLSKLYKEGSDKLVKRYEEQGLDWGIPHAMFALNFTHFCNELISSLKKK